MLLWLQNMQEATRGHKKNHVGETQVMAGSSTVSASFVLPGGRIIKDQVAEETDEKNYKSSFESKN